MCYCCTLCNECGRADEMKSKLGKRECVKCGALISDNDLKDCPNCGTKLPPSFPAIPGALGTAAAATGVASDSSAKHIAWER